MRKFFLFLTLSISLVIFSKTNALAKLGVGVGTGKIVVEEKLKPGQIYKLPSLSIVNTGDEPANYAAGVEFLENQKEEKPPREWFSFDPQGEFYLEPGQSKDVEIRLNIPLKARPGEYFAFLEGHPTKKAEGGATTIGVSAAAKLYFSVAPANFLQGIYYRLLSLWKAYQPWTNIALGTLIFTILISKIRKTFNIQISLKGKSGKEDQ